MGSKRQSVTGMLLIVVGVCLVVCDAAADSAFKPSVRDQLASETSSSTATVVVPPPGSSSSPTPSPSTQSRRSSYRSGDTGQFTKLQGLAALASGFEPRSFDGNSNDSTSLTNRMHYNAIPGSPGPSAYTPGNPGPSAYTPGSPGSSTGGTYITGSPGTYTPTTDKKQASRLFSFNSGGQTLDLGLSFTVPFLSVPTPSLMNLGSDLNLNQATSSILASLTDINWPSVVFIGTVILAAAFLLPQLGALISELTGLAGGYSSTSSYGTTGSYGRTVDRDGVMAVSPLTSLLTQLDEGLAQYDLDASSCAQRAVCSFVEDSELSVRKGSANPSQLVVAGVARSELVQTLLGRTAVTEAAETGRSGSGCSLHYPKCPLSLGGVLRFLASYANLAT